MSDEDERDLPLHDEAEARSKWRGGETFVEGEDADSGPASEIDNAAFGGNAGDNPGPDPVKRPPD
jgi:hypothetical protein